MKIDQMNLKQYGWKLLLFFLALPCMKSTDIKSDHSDDGGSGSDEKKKVTISYKFDDGEKQETLSTALLLEENSIPKKELISQIREKVKSVNSLAGLWLHSNIEWQLTDQLNSDLLSSREDQADESVSLVDNEQYTIQQKVQDSDGFKIRVVYRLLGHGQEQQKVVRVPDKTYSNKKIRLGVVDIYTLILKEIVLGKQAGNQYTLLVNDPSPRRIEPEFCDFDLIKKLYEKKYELGRQKEDDPHKCLEVHIYPSANLIGFHYQDHPYINDDDPYDFEKKYFFTNRLGENATVKEMELLVKEKFGSDIEGFVLAIDEDTAGADVNKMKLLSKHDKRVKNLRAFGKSYLGPIQVYDYRWTIKEINGEKLDEPIQISSLMPHDQLSSLVLQVSNKGHNYDEMTKKDVTLIVRNQKKGPFKQNIMLKSIFKKKYSVVIDNLVFEELTDENKIRLSLQDLRGDQSNNPPQDLGTLKHNATIKDLITLVKNQYNKIGNQAFVIQYGLHLYRSTASENLLQAALPKKLLNQKSGTIQLVDKVKLTFDVMHSQHQSKEITEWVNPMLSIQQIIDSLKLKEAGYKAEDIQTITLVDETILGSETFSLHYSELGSRYLEVLPSNRRTCLHMEGATLLIEYKKEGDNEFSKYELKNFHQLEKYGELKGKLAAAGIIPHDDPHFVLIQPGYPSVRYYNQKTADDTLLNDIGLNKLPSITMLLGSFAFFDIEYEKSGRLETSPIKTPIRITISYEDLLQQLIDEGIIGNSQKDRTTIQVGDHLYGGASFDTTQTIKALGIDQATKITVKVVDSFPDNPNLCTVTINNENRGAAPLLEQLSSVLKKYQGEEWQEYAFSLASQPGQWITNFDEPLTKWVNESDENPAINLTAERYWVNLKQELQGAHVKLNGVFPTSPFAALGYSDKKDANGKVIVYDYFMINKEGGIEKKLDSSLSLIESGVEPNDTILVHPITAKPPVVGNPPNQKDNQEPDSDGDHFLRNSIIVVVTMLVVGLVGFKLWKMKSDQATQS